MKGDSRKKVFGLTLKVAFALTLSYTAVSTYQIHKTVKVESSARDTVLVPVDSIPGIKWTIRESTFVHHFTVTDTTDFSEHLHRWKVDGRRP